MAISRRRFLIGSGLVGGGLVLGFTLGGGKPEVPGTVAGSFQPNAWLQITRDGRVIFQLHKVEMGQGVMTALPLIVGEELDFDPAGFEIAMAGVHPDFKAHALSTQITGGSNSIATSWDVLRHAGAAARAMLVAAAARRWGVSGEQCSTDNGAVINDSDRRRLNYAELAEEAQAFTDVAYELKPAVNYRWVGRASSPGYPHGYPRLDAVGKSTGSARFGLDVDLEGMKVAVIVRCPYFGGSLKRWDIAGVKKLQGVVAAFEVHSGIAIVAEGYWPARRAAQQLQVEWHKGPLAGLDSTGIRRQQERVLEAQEPYVALERGDIDSVSKAPELILSARYSAPHTHHSPMEPQNATALYTEHPAGNRCEVWAPNQAPDICRALVMHYGEVSADNAIVHTTLLGGGFGRRGYPDFVAEAVAVARQLPGTAVKVIWSREDDMRHDFYRPASLHGLEASLDPQGHIETWRHRLVAPSILRGFGVYLVSGMLPTWVPTRVARGLGRNLGSGLAEYDPTLSDGARIPYSVPHLSVEQIEHDPGIPVGFWRSVSHSFNVFAVEGFIDELSHRAGMDPLDFRLQHLPESPRHRGVLELAAARAGWGKAAAGIGRGIAVAEPYDSFCAVVVEVSAGDNAFTVKRVVAAVDCGLVVCPDIVRSQIESGIVYGLGAAIKAPVSFADGRTVQSNFHDLPVLRINEMPRVEVHIVDSTEQPTGVGEIAVPVVAPALANALFAATGKRLRDLPLALS